MSLTLTWLGVVADAVCFFSRTMSTPMNCLRDFIFAGTETHIGETRETVAQMEVQRDQLKTTAAKMEQMVDSLAPRQDDATAKEPGETTSSMAPQQDQTITDGCHGDGAGRDRFLSSPGCYDGGWAKASSVPRLGSLW